LAAFFQKPNPCHEILVELANLPHKKQYSDAQAIVSVAEIDQYSVIFFSYMDDPNILRACNPLLENLFGFSSQINYGTSGKYRLKFGQF